MAQPVANNETIAAVAAISANNDPEIGRIMANAFDKVGVSFDAPIAPFTLAVPGLLH